VKQVATIRDAGCLTAMAHPLRVRALKHLREPASAATIARAVGVPRQKVNFHIKQLEQAGLIRKVRERRTGGFVEDLYRRSQRRLLCLRG
jgi:DNA-binding transcriptional ArsR family regulator